MTTRLKNGRWRTGQSGNPGGRPAGVTEIREFALRYGVEAIQSLVKEMREGDTSHARIAAAKAILDRAVGKPTQLIAGDADERPIVLTNEERREQMRELVRRAFTQVINDHPELAPEEAKCLPGAPPSSVASGSIEQLAAKPAASIGHDRVEQQPRAFALPPQRPPRYRPPPTVRSSWSS